MTYEYALDACYSVEDGRHSLVERMLALGFGIASVVIVTATIEMMVAGPLGDPNSGPAAWLGLGSVYVVAWHILRWPVLFAIIVGFLLTVPAAIGPVPTEPLAEHVPALADPAERP